MVTTLLIAVLSLPAASEGPIAVSSVPLTVAVSSLPLTGAVFPSPHELVRGPAALSDWTVKPAWFPEALEFEVKWGIFMVGWASLKVQEVVDFAGQTAFRLVNEAQSNKFCDGFYKVRDINESWIRVSDHRSLGYSKKLREGQFFRDEWVRFEYSDNTFTSHKVDRDGTVTPSSGTIPGPVQDILSSIYYLRPKSLKVGEEVILDVNDKSNWPLVVRVIRKQRITVPAGTFDTVLVEPALRQEGLFIQKGKKLEVWLTDDDRHMPVFMRVEVFFGHISAYLKKIGV
jgi:hypothetical protein